MYEGSNFTVNIRLFERYPLKYTVAYIMSAEYYIPNSVVYIEDFISGGQSSKITYNSTVVDISSSSSVKRPVGIFYEIFAKDPNTELPYSLPITFLATRSGADGLSKTPTFNRFVPVVGAIANEVPNFIPAATDPTLIYFVLRDPPGGTSSASLSTGSSISFSMSIDSMYSYDGSFDSGSSHVVGASIDLSTMEAPFGFGIDTLGSSLKYLNDQGSSTSHSISASRDTSNSFEYTIDFTFEISTSTNPHIAGHPSDIIVGGGVDLIVSIAQEG
jgi:hypothetical protein